MVFIHLDVVVLLINIDRCLLTKSIIPLKYFFCYLSILMESTIGY